MLTTLLRAFPFASSVSTRIWRGKGQDLHNSYKCLRTSGPRKPGLNTFLAMDICKVALWKAVPSTKLSSTIIISVTVEGK